MPFLAPLGPAIAGAGGAAAAAAGTAAAGASLSSIIGTTLAIAGTAAGLAQSRAQSKAGDKAGRAAAASAGRAADAARRDVDFAREQFALFSPTIDTTTDFFRNVTIDNVFDDRLLAQETESKITAANQIAEQQTGAVQQNIAERGLAGSGIAAQQLMQPEIGRQQSIVDIRNTQRRQSLADRLALAGQGVGASQDVLSAGTTQQGVLQQQAFRQSDLAGGLSQAAGQTAAGAGALFSTALPGLSGLIRRQPSPPNGL